jgi:hypothetical protein
MSHPGELDSLSSKELHDRAMKLARHHLDVKFLWALLREIPAAEAATGNLQQTDADIEGTPGTFNAPFDLLADLMRSDEGALADALRPVYIDYLEKHSDHDPDEPSSG